MKVELVTNELDVSYIVHEPFRWCNSRCLNVTICDSPHMKCRNGLPSIPICHVKMIGRSKDARALVIDMCAGQHEWPIISASTIDET